MHLVYSLAHVTLSATSSPSSTHGLFNKASYDHTANFTQFLQIDNMLSDGAPSTLFVPGEMVDDRNGEKGTWHDGYERLWARLATQGPLAKRAWTCQEQILSPQILHFTDAQLFWKCRQVDQCLGGTGTRTYPEPQRPSAKTSSFQASYVLGGWSLYPDRLRSYRLAPTALRT